VSLSWQCEWRALQEGYQHRDRHLGVGARAGDFSFIAGMQGVDPATNKLVEGDEARIRQAFLNLKLIAESEDATLPSLSFPKILSGRNGGEAQTGSGRRQWYWTAGMTGNGRPGHSRSRTVTATVGVDILPFSEFPGATQKGSRPGVPAAPTGALRHLED
jgi:hypothetical protein